MLDERRAGQVLTCVVAAALAVLCGTAAIALFPQLASAVGLEVGATPAYSEGGAVDLPAEVYSDSPITLIAFVRSSCPVCLESRVALRAVADAVHRQPSVKMVVVTTSGVSSDLEADIAYGREIGVAASDVFPMNAAALRLKWVPSLLLVDRTGRILKVHEGLIDSAATDDWIGSLKRLMRS